MSEPLLDLLRAWWLAGRERGVMLPGGWLFPGQNPVTPLTTRQLRRAFHGAKEAAGISLVATMVGAVAVVITLPFSALGGNVARTDPNPEPPRVYPTNRLLTRPLRRKASAEAR